MNFQHQWITVDWLSDFRTPIWYFLWGFVLGISLIYAILNKNFLFAVILVLGLIFIFHPEFQKSKIINVILNDKEIIINNEKYNLEDYYTFLIDKINERYFLELYPKSFFKKEIHLPIPENKIDQVREDLKKIMPESKIPPRILTYIFRHFWP